MKVNMSQLAKIIDNDKVVPSEKMENLLVALSMVRTEARQRAAPFKANIEAEQAKMESVIVDLSMQETEIKAAIEDCLETEFAFDGWKYKGKAGSAQIVRPKNRVTYDVKGLETLRLSFKDVDGMIGHLRVEKPSKPYLKIKLK